MAELILYEEMIRGLTILFRVTIDYLVLKQPGSEQHPNTNKIIFGNMKCFILEYIGNMPSRDCLLQGEISQEMSQET